jgi:type I restriction-modification system DNA methylase subunit
MNEEIRALADRYAAELKRNIDGRAGDIAVYGQESNYTSWKLARMNVAIRGIDANPGPRNADSFRADLHPDLHVECVFADMKTLSAEIYGNSFNCYLHARN